MIIHPKAGNRVQIFSRDNRGPAYLDIFTIPGSTNSFEIMVKVMKEKDENGQLIPMDGDALTQRLVIDAEGR